MAKAQRSRYYTPNEVALHNTPSDLWVSFLGKVYDLTDLVKNNLENDLIAPILAVAGQDISHWFNPRTGDIKTHFDAEKVIFRTLTSVHEKFRELKSTTAHMADSFTYLHQSQDQTIQPILDDHGGAIQNMR